MSGTPLLSQMVSHATLGLVLATLLLLNLRVAAEVGVDLGEVKQLVMVSAYCILIYAALPSLVTVGLTGYSKILELRSEVKA